MRNRRFAGAPGSVGLNVRRDDTAMPANFFLLMYTQRAVAELMAECARCGAITTQVLESRLGGPDR